MKERKIRYKVFSLRLSRKTRKRLIDFKRKSGVSWNLFVFDLINVYEKKPKSNKGR